MSKYLLVFFASLIIENCNAKTCQATEFQCGNRNSTAVILERDQCIPLEQVCDGVPDCPFSDDEWNCPSFDICSNSNNTFTCKTGNICILKAWTCDGLWDCPDQSDEANELCNKASKCDGFVCTNTNNRCVPLQNVCNNKTYDGCLDFQDELSCSSAPTTTLTTINVNNPSTISNETTTKSSPSSTTTTTTTSTSTTTQTPSIPSPSRKDHFPINPTQMTNNASTNGNDNNQNLNDQHMINKDDNNSFNSLLKTYLPIAIIFALIVIISIIVVAYKIYKNNKNKSTNANANANANANNNSKNIGQKYHERERVPSYSNSKVTTV